MRRCTQFAAPLMCFFEATGGYAGMNPHAVGQTNPAARPFSSEIANPLILLAKSACDEDASPRLSAIRLPRFLRWLDEISSRLIGISMAVDAAGDVPPL
jgi:hypothetical protein